MRTMKTIKTIRTRNKSGLGSSTAVHTEGGKAAIKNIELSAKRVHEYVREGSCVKALLAYADMQRYDAEAELHMRSGGKDIWIPATRIQEAAGQFVDRCLIIHQEEK